MTNSNLLSEFEYRLNDVPEISTEQVNILSATGSTGGSSLLTALEALKIVSKDNLYKRLNKKIRQMQEEYNTIFSNYDYDLEVESLEWIDFRYTLCKELSKEETDIYKVKDIYRDKVEYPLVAVVSITDIHEDYAVYYENTMEKLSNIDFEYNGMSNKYIGLVTPTVKDNLRGRSITRMDLLFRFLLLNAKESVASTILISTHDYIDVGGRIVYTVFDKDFIVNTFDLAYEDIVELKNYIITSVVGTHIKNGQGSFVFTPTMLPWKDCGFTLRININEERTNRPTLDSSIDMFDGLYLSIRLLDSNYTQGSLENLNLDKGTISALESAWLKPSGGIIFIAGKQDSGKTSLGFTWINNALKPENRDRLFKEGMVVSDSREVPTLYHKTQITEKNDNIKFMSDIVTTKASFVFLGETKEPSHCKLLTNLASTSMSVLTTLHLASVKELPDRLFQLMGKEAIVALSYTSMITVQNLVKEPCHLCSEVLDVKDIPEFSDIQKIAINELGIETLYYPVERNTCNRCNGKGYSLQRRVPINETMFITEDTKSRFGNCDTKKEAINIIVDYLEKNKCSLKYILKEKLGKAEVHYSSVLLLI